MHAARIGVGRFAKIGSPIPEVTDGSMLLGLVFLLVAGAGPRSLDALIESRAT